MAKKWKPTKAWAVKAKKATETLIEKYKKGISPIGMHTCPYCILFYNKNFAGSIESCLKCPWVVFRKNKCFHLPAYELSAPKNFPRLRGWLRKCNNIINRRVT